MRTPATGVPAAGALLPVAGGVVLLVQAEATMNVASAVASSRLNANLLKTRPIPRFRR